ncbi:Uncharacterized protein Rs2_04836 [Raphanus sativus]|nr:Uncharacterized protein Rs2_04836 [Raphanus sativus]
MNQECYALSCDPSMVVLLAVLKKEFVAFRDELKKMAQEWEDQAAMWRKKMTTWKTERMTEKKPTRLVQSESLTLVTSSLKRSSLKRSATSPRKQGQDQTVPVKHHHHTVLAKNSGKCSWSNSSKHVSGFSYLQLLPRHVSFGTHGKHPFDRGRNGDGEICIVKEEAALGRPPPLRDKKSAHSHMLLWTRNITCKDLDVVLNLEDKVL